MSEARFPSGPWKGFYNYRHDITRRHRMELNLNFAKGIIRGEGVDDIGQFLISGRYNAADGECHWTKTYIGSHDVYYRGFREGKGIWGIWEIGAQGHGGFRIWPKGEGEELAEAEAAEQTAPAEAVGSQMPEAVPSEPDRTAELQLTHAPLTWPCGQRLFSGGPLGGRV